MYKVSVKIYKEIYYSSKFTKNNKMISLIPIGTYLLNKLIKYLVVLALYLILLQAYLQRCRTLAFTLSCRDCRG